MWVCLFGILSSAMLVIRNYLFWCGSCCPSDISDSNDKDSDERADDEKNFKIEEGKLN